MEADDLDNLIADSLAGVQTALEGDRKASSSQVTPDAAAASASEAMKQLKEGPPRDGDGNVVEPNEAFFSNLVKSFQEESFQKSMAEALQITAEKESSSSLALAGPSAPPAAESGAEDFLKNFMSSFESAVGNDQGFADQMSSLVTSMLSKDVIVEPLKQIADALEPWLRDQKGLSASERSRYEAQLKLYKEIVHLYKSNSDPLPDGAQQEVHRLLAELHTLGEPPADVMKGIAPKEAADGDESFEDFVKSMGLGDNLGAAEQDLLKKLTEDPEELTKVMKDMAGKLDGESPEEACKQQ